MRSIICVIFVLNLNSLGLPAKLPDSVKTCHRKDANFQQCLAEAMTAFLKQSTKADRSLGVHQLDPYFVKECTANAGTQGTVDFEQKYKNSKLFGFSTLNVDTADMDFDKKKLKWHGIIPVLAIKGEYDFNGRLLLLPLKGRGNYQYKIDKFEITSEIDFDEITKNDRKFYKVVDVKTHLKLGKLHFQLDNLFDGNKQLGDNLNQVLNDNWQAVFDDVRGAYETLFSTIIKTEATAIFNHIPIDEIFPE